MSTLYGDFRGHVTSSASAYGLAYSGAGLFDLSPLAAELMELLPSYYFLGNNNRRIMELIAVVLQEWRDDIYSVRDQFFVETATWGLVYWEQLVGIPPNPNDLDYDARRAAIIAKLSDCSSEKCFREGLEAIIGGPVFIIDLDPVTNPYQLDIELRSGNIVYLGPATFPTAAVGGSGPLTGDYTYKVTYEFPPVVIPNYIGLSPSNLGETSSGVSPNRVNEVHLITATAPATDGTFTITYDDVWDQSVPPHPLTTAPIPWDATRNDVKQAMEALPNLYPGNVNVTGGPLPINPIVIEYRGYLSGFPQPVIQIDGSNLVGGVYEPSRVQQGATTYSSSESNTVTASGNRIVLTDVPISPEGASRRNIYRKKNASPYNEYRYVGSIDDNVTKIFTDTLSDDDLSETQTIVGTGAGTFKLRFDSADTVDISDTATAGDIKSAIEALSTVAYPTIGVTVTGTSLASGYEVKFNGGDVEGKDVPEMVAVDEVGMSVEVSTTSSPKRLVESNSAFTFTLQKVLSYIYNTKPAHIRIRELRSEAFRASINKAGDPV